MQVILVVIGSVLILESWLRQDAVMAGDKTCVIQKIWARYKKNWLSKLFSLKKYLNSAVRIIVDNSLPIH